MDPDAPWQGSPEAAPRKAIEAEHDAASRSYVQRDGKTGTVDAKGRARRTLTLISANVSFVSATFGGGIAPGVEVFISITRTTNKWPPPSRRC
jgi:hypothetical protein